MRIAFIVFTVLCVLTGCQSFSLAPGQKLPSFPVTSQSGEKIILGDAIKGPALIVFFAAWCEVCQSEVSELNALYERMKGKGFSVVGVAMEQSDAELKRFINERNPSYPIFHDEQALYKKPFKITGFPESILIDNENRLMMVADPSSLSSNPTTLKFIGSRPWSNETFVNLILSNMQAS